MSRPSTVRTRFSARAKDFMGRYLDAMAYADPSGLGWPSMYLPEPAPAAEPAPQTQPEVNGRASRGRNVAQVAAGLAR